MFLDWLEALSAAVDLSPALEERSLPRYQTIPRRRRRRRSAPATQEAIIRRNFPNIGEAAQQQLAAAVIAARNRNNTPNPLRAGAASSHRPSLAQESISEQDLRDLQLEITPSPPPLPQARPQQPQSRRPPRPQQEEENCFSESGKWAPAQNITAEANMRYARRCMAILCGDAPRQSDYIIKDGKRYKLSWEKKEMVLEEKPVIRTEFPPPPPTYEEVAGGRIGITLIGSSSRLI